MRNKEDLVGRIYCLVIGLLLITIVIKYQTKSCKTTTNKVYSKESSHIQKSSHQMH
jgi:hypothetical protein